MVISPAHAARYRAHYAARGPFPEPQRMRQHPWHSAIVALHDEVQAASVLDYGCGPWLQLQRSLPFQVTSYDPGVPGCDLEPSHEPWQKFDLVVCSHTLEHVERGCAGVVIADLYLRTAKALLLVVSLEPSTKVLPDGTAWHTVVEPAAYWRDLLEHFDWLHIDEQEPRSVGEYAVICRK